jgi:hypothetical protein
VRDSPQTISQAEAKLAYSFIEEELYELYDDGLYANGETVCTPEECTCTGVNGYNPNVVEIADALGDIVFTAYGMAVRHGIDLDLVLKEICESNMTKTPNGQGKIKKTEGVYVPPNISRALAL